MLPAFVDRWQWQIGRLHIGFFRTVNIAYFYRHRNAFTALRVGPIRLEWESGQEPLT